MEFLSSQRVGDNNFIEPFCINIYVRFLCYNNITDQLPNTASAPLILTSTTNVLSIDLPSYSSTLIISGVYQPKLTVTTPTESPVIFNNSTLSTTVGSYYTRNEDLFAERYSVEVVLGFIQLEPIDYVLSYLIYFSRIYSRGYKWCFMDKRSHIHLRYQFNTQANSG